MSNNYIHRLIEAFRKWGECSHLFYQTVTWLASSDTSNIDLVPLWNQMSRLYYFYVSFVSSGSVCVCLHLCEWDVCACQVYKQRSENSFRRQSGLVFHLKRGSVSATYSRLASLQASWDSLFLPSISIEKCCDGRHVIMHWAFQDFWAFEFRPLCLYVWSFNH